MLNKVFGQIGGIFGKLGKPVKKMILIAIIFIAALIGFSVYGQIREAQRNKTPVVSIEASNNNTYSDTIARSDFTIIATHQDGEQTQVDPSTVTIKPRTVNPYGKITNVTVTLKNDKSVKCQTTVKNDRTKVLAFNVGLPNDKDVTAVLYADGELSFEGEGDVAHYDEGNYPWQTYNLDENGEEIEDSEYPSVRGVTFQKTVTPTNMDGWFQDLTDLIYVAKLPTSITSLSATFSGCTSLKTAPDWSGCDKLLDVNACFDGCESLSKTMPLPKNVRNVASTYQNCYALEETPVIETAVHLKDTESMLNGSDGIMKPCVLPKSLQYMDSMFEGCINLREMPKIPSKVESMNASFSGCSMLEKVTNVPAKVTDVSSCFLNCTQLNGTLKIDANPSDFEQCFENTSYATTLNLKGKSKMLDVLANTSESNNIYVKGKKPNPDLTTWDDVFGSK